MRRVLLGLALVTPTMVSGDLFPGSPGGPELLTPGSATWSTMTVPGGERTVYTLSGDTILSWADLQVGAADELVFEGGWSVANLLGAGANHRIDGLVKADGAIGFFANGGTLTVDGRVEAASVSLSALRLEDAAAYLGGGGYAMDGGSGRLRLRGTVRAESGDLVYAGTVVQIDDQADLEARGAIRGGAGTRVEVAGSGDQRLTVGGQAGLILHLGHSRAASHELVAVNGVENQGRLETPFASGQVFFEVGPGGGIVNQPTGVILGDLEVLGDFDNDGVVLGGDEADTAVAVHSSTSRLPELRRPDGTRVSRARELRVSAPMTASADAQRDRAARQATVASRGGGTLLSRQSIFGFRGDTPAPQAPEKKKRQR